MITGSAGKLHYRRPANQSPTVRTTPVAVQQLGTQLLEQQHLSPLHESEFNC